jgi:hypothetical protein
MYRVTGVITVFNSHMYRVAGVITGYSVAGVIRVQ